MKIMRKALGIRRADLRELGEGQGIRHVEDVIGQVLDAVGGWEEIAKDHGLPKPVIGQVAQEHGLG